VTKRSQVSKRFGKEATIALIFTDIVDSTVRVRELGTKDWVELVEKHFEQANVFEGCFDGCEVKRIGDACMIVFPTAEKALRFSIAFLKDPGHPSIVIRAGIHVGTVQVSGDDVYGVMVNYTRRVIEAMKGCGIALSDRARWDIEDQLGPALEGLGEFRPLPHDGLKGFPDEVLWEFVIPKEKAQRIA
jgi:adenylate cyclase